MSLLVESGAEEHTTNKDMAEIVERTPPSRPAAKNSSGERTRLSTMDTMDILARLPSPTSNGIKAEVTNDMSTIPTASARLNLDNLDGHAQNPDNVKKEDGNSTAEALAALIHSQAQDTDRVETKVSVENPCTTFVRRSSRYKPKTNDSFSENDLTPIPVEQDRCSVSIILAGGMLNEDNNSGNLVALMEPKKNTPKKNASKIKLQLRSETFNRHIEELTAFKHDHGHCEVQWSGETKPLNRWCAEIRCAYPIYCEHQTNGSDETKCGKIHLTKENVEILKKMEFGFETRNRKRKKNNAETIVAIEKLPEAPQIPSIPNTGKCNWSFDHEQRVLLANFNVGKSKPELIPLDKSFLLRMMERTDIAVVSEGLFEHFDPSVWDLDFIDSRTGDKMYHRFRLFEKRATTEENIASKRIGLEQEEVDETAPSVQQYLERDGDISMKICDYIRYLRQWEEIQKKPENDPNFSYVTPKGTECVLDVRKYSVYLIDLDLKKFLPETLDDFMAHFLAPDFLPGGKHCMMNAVNKDGRPFMGPNLYQTPPGGFTHFHQDGHGTVDSGHICIQGYNEVVMLARMDEANKKHALHLLTCSDRRKGKKLEFDALYGLPHHDGEKPCWPDDIAIHKCRELNYYPCVLILKPGQLLHINKGRLHAFRKMSCSPLDHGDCHYKLRNQVIEKNGITTEQLCTSVAWDWMFLGVSRDGVNGEVMSTLECVQLLHNEGKQSLAIPQLCLIELAKFHLAKHRYNQKQRISGLDHDDNSLTILKGIYLGLRQVLAEQIQPFSSTYEGNEGKDGLGEFETLRIQNTPDVLHDPQKVTVDPFGNDFFCMLCHQELGNAYIHCDGCEVILQKDFNICISCHSVKELRQQKFQMHPLCPLSKSAGKRSDYNHIPSHSKSRKSCNCKHGPMCKKCGYMVCCSCKCHKKYSLRTRFYNGEDMKKLLHSVEACVKESVECARVMTHPTTFHEGSTDRVDGTQTSMILEQFSPDTQVVCFPPQKDPASSMILESNHSVSV